MQEIQKMQGGKYYLIESTASANSIYFEDDALSKLFFRYCDYYLKDYVEVKEYVLNQDGWVMLIKIKSNKTIRKYYSKVESKRMANTPTQKNVKIKPIWKILSERVRLFISTYVRMSNKMLGREGSLVRRKYTRYSFESLDQAQAYLSRISKEEQSLQQTKEKYRGLSECFQMSGTLLTNPLRSSLWAEMCAVRECVKEKLVEVFGFELPVLKELGALVAQNHKFEKSTLNPPPPKPTKH